MEQTVIYLSVVNKFINLKEKILRLYQLHYVYDFSVDYDAIAVDDILDFHDHLMKKNDIV